MICNCVYSESLDFMDSCIITVYFLLLTKHCWAGNGETVCPLHIIILYLCSFAAVHLSAGITLSVVAVDTCQDPK